MQTPLLHKEGGSVEAMTEVIPNTHDNLDDDTPTAPAATGVDLGGRLVLAVARAWLASNPSAHDVAMVLRELLAMVAK